MVVFENKKSVGLTNYYLSLQEEKKINCSILFLVIKEYVHIAQYIIQHGY